MFFLHCFFYFFFFFFSSRRRHTRCGRDWSSDVCSSDLTCFAGSGDTRRSAQRRRRRSSRRRARSAGRAAAGARRGGAVRVGTPANRSARAPRRRSRGPRARAPGGGTARSERAPAALACWRAARRRAARERFAIRPDCDTVRAMPPQRDRVAGPRVPSILVHGGAGADPVEGRDELRAGVQVAILEGWRILAGGGSALDAVERAVRALEDHPRFNAGRGSVLTSAGAVETDASIMEGDRLQCGAVGAVSRIANPVTLARRVIEARHHILLVGEGALAFARAQGLPAFDPEAP